MEYDPQTIIDSINRYRAGSTEAFATIYEGTYRLVYSTCYGIIKDEEDARDVTQDVFLKIYEKLDTLNNPAAYGKWMKLTASNMSLDFIRRKGHTYNVEDDSELDMALSDWEQFDSIPDSFIEDEEKRQIINKVLKESLSDVQYQTVFMYYFSEMPLASIADSMSCPEGTVKTRLMHAKDKFRKSLEKYIDDNKLVLAATPFMTRFFNAEMPKISVPDISSLGIQGLTGNPGAVTASSNAAQSAVQSAAHSAAQSAGQMGATAAKAGFLATAAGKIAVGGAALALVGTVTAVAFNLPKKNEPVISETTTSIVTEGTSAAVTTATTVTQPVPVVEVNAGDKGTCGKYDGKDIEWIVLDKTGDKVLLLSRYAIEAMPYDVDWGSAQWEYSSLRKWLNNDLYNSAFSPDEKEHIQMTHLNNADSQNFGNDTDDNVFILSAEEVEKYFTSDEDRRVLATEHAVNNGACVSDGYDGSSCWWVRSVGDDVSFVSCAGDIAYDVGEALRTDIGVRPAIWIDSSAVKIIDDETSATDPSDTSTGGVRVYDSADSKMITVDGSEYDFMIPEVEIPGLNMGKVNKTLKKYANKYNSGKKKGKYSSTYNAYIGEKVVSIIIYNWRIGYEEEATSMKIYNIEIETGKIIKDSKVVGLCGLTDKAFFSIVKTTYKNFEKSQLEQFDYFDPARLKKWLSKNYKRISYKYIIPFIGPEGQLCFAGDVYYYGGAGKGYMYFDAVKKDQW